MEFEKIQIKSENQMNPKGTFLRRMFEESPYTFMDTFEFIDDELLDLERLRQKIAKNGFLEPSLEEAS